MTLLETTETTDFSKHVSKVVITYNKRTGQRRAAMILDRGKTIYDGCGPVELTKYYILNDGRFCNVVRWHGDMAMVRYTNNRSLSMGDIHKSRLIRIK